MTEPGRDYQSGIKTEYISNFLDQYPSGNQGAIDISNGAGTGKLGLAGIGGRGAPRPQWRHLASTFIPTRIKQSGCAADFASSFSMKLTMEGDSPKAVRWGKKKKGHKTMEISFHSK